MGYILITGVAGFIGANLALKILNTYKDTKIIGVDNLNDYYDVDLKKYRLELISRKSKQDRFIFKKYDIADSDTIMNLFAQYDIEYVINLAAQAGVRYSLVNPDAYFRSNIVGFYTILEACKKEHINGRGIKNFVFASSSSVYGNNNKIPFSERDKTDEPVSLYAATKKSNELLAYSYAKVYGIPTTGLRFFTVYGPAGRPDMAYFSFTESLKDKKNIKVYNYGNCERDFTYIDDIVEGIIKAIWNSPVIELRDKAKTDTPYRIYNIGNGNPVNLLTFIEILQKELIRAEVLPADYDFESHKEFVEMQPGDVPITYADTTLLEEDLGYRPSTDLACGIRKFVEWYVDYYRIKGR